MDVLIIVMYAFVGFIAIMLLWIATSLSGIAHGFRLNQLILSRLISSIQQFTIKYKRQSH